MFQNYFYLCLMIYWQVLNQSTQIYKKDLDAKWNELVSSTTYTKHISWAITKASTKEKKAVVYGS